MFLDPTPGVFTIRIEFFAKKFLHCNLFWDDLKFCYKPNKDCASQYAAHWIKSYAERN